MSTIQRLKASLDKPGVYLIPETNAIVPDVKPLGMPLVIRINECESLETKILHSAPSAARGYEISDPKSVGEVIDFMEVYDYAVKYLTW